MSAPRDGESLLVLDSGSPIVSVAVGTARGGAIATRSIEIAHSSEAILRLIDDALAAAGIAKTALGGLVGLIGPGSFTGLRVGMATLLGLHQALGIPATGVSTLEVMALAPRRSSGSIMAVVNALRGEWFTQLFGSSRVAEAPSLRRAGEISALEPDSVVGHGLTELARSLPPATEVVEAAKLAPLAFDHLATRAVEWEPSALLEPLYLRPPAAALRGPS